jgi:hypothetical protein
VTAIIQLVTHKLNHDSAHAYCLCNKGTATLENSVIAQLLQPSGGIVRALTTCGPEWYPNPQFQCSTRSKTAHHTDVINHTSTNITANNYQTKCQLGQPTFITQSAKKFPWLVGNKGHGVSPALLTLVYVAILPSAASQDGWQCQSNIRVKRMVRHVDKCGQVRWSECQQLQEGAKAVKSWDFLRPLVLKNQIRQHWIT